MGENFQILIDYAQNNLKCMTYKTVTRSLIFNLYWKYNKEYFDNKLPPCEFSVVNGAGFTGLFMCSTDKTPPKIYIAKTPSANSKDKWEEKDLKQTLIHEMVHCYVCEIMKFRWCFFQHGIHFRLICLKLLIKYKYRVYLTAINLKEKPSTITEKLKALYKHILYSFYAIFI